MADHTVLIVDDEAGVRTVAARLLQRLGWSVLTADDGPSAVDILRTRADDIACVLLDVAMPRLSGQETLGELRAIKADVPVVLMSGYSEQEALPCVTSACPAGFLQKPFTPEELQRAIQKAVRAV